MTITSATDLRRRLDGIAAIEGDRLRVTDASRFRSESGRLADLEVRSRMTGRWMMASIQTSFAIMPALVYLFAGHFAGAISIGTVVAFTTLQSRLFFPVGSLLGVSLEENLAMISERTP